MGNDNSMILTALNRQSPCEVYKCELTDELDDCVIDELKEYSSYHNGSCLWKPEINYDGNTIMVFRYPGATRGCIQLDENNIITNIEFIESTCFDSKIGCYQRRVVEATERFIGRTLVFPE